MFQERALVGYEVAIDGGIARVDAGMDGAIVAARDAPVAQQVLPLPFLTQRRSIVMPSPAAASRFRAEAR
jgi:hypothetical protein